MRQDEISIDLSELAFCFFYKYSRMEFALKESDYLRTHEPGSPAEPDWCKFAKRWREEYCVSDAARRLIFAALKRQEVAADKRLAWKDVDLRQCTSDLEKAI